MLQLVRYDVHLWVVFLHELQDVQLESCRAFLSREERAKQERFFFEKDRRRDLVTRALVRTVLSRYIPLSPAAWQFSANAYGRPEVCNPEAKRADLVFNVSHTDGLVVVAVTKGRRLGVDVEEWRYRPAPLEIASRYFSPQEAAALASIPLGEQQQRFFEYWTLKESYIKACEKGLSIPLHEFSFQLSAGAIEFATVRQAAENAAGWDFWQLRPSANHVLALCAERVEGEPAKLMTMRTVPGERDEPLTVTGVRTSK